MSKQIKAGFPGFEHRVKSLLWGKIVGPKNDRPDYIRWENLVKELQEEEGVNRRQAIVNASLTFDCLSVIIADYNLSQYGVPNTSINAEATVSVSSRDVRQSYRENLRWAIDAAGKFMRTKEEPKTCPNDAAYYLYQQAIQDPKDFLGKVGQVEVKASSQEEIEENDRKQATKSIEEIDEMLATLEEENDEY